MPQFRRVKRIKKTFTFVWNDLVESQASLMEGVIHQIHFRVPTTVNNVTATLTLEDEDGYEVYNSGAKADATNYNIIPPLSNGAKQIISGNFTMKVTLSGAHGVIGPPATPDIDVIAVIYLDGMTGT